MRTYVTSMSRKMFDDMGKEMLEKLDRYWPRGDLIIYSEDPLPTLTLDREYAHRRLMDVPGFNAFIATCSTSPIFSGMLHDKRNYQLDARMFAHKSFAIFGAAFGRKDHLIWIDADVMTLKFVPEKILENVIFGYSMAMMRRKTWHACSSFVAWDLNTEFTQKFFESLYHLYISGTIFALPQWHDAYLIESLALDEKGELKEEVNDIASEISGEGPYNVFDEVFIGLARHFKGNKKVPYRYTQLLELVKNRQPARIVEIGTWNGERACQMLDLSPKSEYIGFDLFEEATEDTDQAEKNVKTHYTEEEVHAKLSNITEKFTLYKGDSKHQHDNYINFHGINSADLVFIDGGHSVETIKADLEFAKKIIKENCPIILDDYYEGMPEEELAKFGCQGILDGTPHQILPIKDNVMGGGSVQMAVVSG